MVGDAVYMRSGTQIPCRLVLRGWVYILSAGSCLAGIATMYSLRSEQLNCGERGGEQEKEEALTSVLFLWAFWKEDAHLDGPQV